METLSETLQAMMGRAGVGTRTLSKLTGIPRTAIDNWRDGRARRPQHWRPLLQIARVLSLSPAAADALLAAAGYPPIATLAGDLPLAHPDRKYLHPWLGAKPAEGVPTPAPVRHQLRAPAADFVGRTDVIERLLIALRRVQEGAVAAISGVRGMGGIGKTELAYLVAHQLSDTFPDAQIVLNLRGTRATPLPPEQALQQIIRAFTPDARLPDDVDALHQRYCAVLHGQRVLILADDARDATQVRPLLPPPGCALLVTSRVRFSLPGMATVDLEQLDADAAVTLLHSTCDRLTMADAQAITQACGYLPLALRISGSILHNDPALSVAHYLAQLVDERQRLKHLRDPDDPQLDMEASLRLSYVQLDAATQHIFRQLGVFVTDFATSLALAVVEAAEGVDIELTLRLLLRRNLIMYDAQHGRWRQHDLLRDLAQRELECTGEWEATMWRYAHAAVQIARETQKQYLLGDEAALTALAQFDAERLHIDIGRHWMNAHAGTLVGDRLLLDIAAATQRIGELRYDVRCERTSLWERALEAARRLGDKYAEELTLNNLGNAYADLGDLRRAIDYYEQRLTIARALGDQRGEGAALNNLGAAYTDLGDFRRAIGYYEQFLAITHEVGDQEGEGVALGNLGNAYLDLGEVMRAIAYYEQSLTITREIGDRHGEGYALGNLGNAYRALEDFRRAIAYYEQSLTITREIGDRRMEGSALNNLGNAYANLGDIERAIDACSGALAIRREIGDRRGEGYALSYLARAQAQQGDLVSSTTAFEQALTLFHDVGDRAGEAECRWQFGLALANWGACDQALPLLHTALAYEQKIGHAKAAEHATLLAQLEAGATLPQRMLPMAGQHAVGEVARASMDKRACGGCATFTPDSTRVDAAADESS